MNKTFEAPPNGGAPRVERGNGPFMGAAGGPPNGKTIVFPAERALVTDGGGRITPLSIGYETYGELNAERSNAILLCHALTGDQYAGGAHPVTGKTGWWDAMVGPGKPFDTDRYFIICSNVVGGCMGTTGPASINPVTGRPYGLDFPVVTIRDMVRAQAMLDRSSGHRHAVLRCRRIDGRHAGAAMGGELSAAGVLGHADRDGRETFGAEHRLSRGWTPGGDGGP